LYVGVAAVLFKERYFGSVDPEHDQIEGEGHTHDHRGGEQYIDMRVSQTVSQQRDYRPSDDGHGLPDENIDEHCEELAGFLIDR
jgi:hypothetical protein